jgi:hypothetical protein
MLSKILTPSSIPPTRSQMSLLVGPPETSDGRVRIFPSWHHHHHGCPRSYITRGMNNRTVCGRGSETFHAIDVINEQSNTCYGVCCRLSCIGDRFLSEIFVSFLSIFFHRGYSRSHITWGINNRPDCGRSSEISSHPIDVNDNKYFWTVFEELELFNEKRYLKRH